MILIAWCSACRYCLLLFYSPVVIVDVHVESCLFPFMYVINCKEERNDVFGVLFGFWERRSNQSNLKSVKSVSNNHSQSVGRVQAWRIQFSYIRYTSVWRCLAVTGGVWRCKRVEERPFTSQSKEFYTYSPRILLHRQPPPATASHRQTLNFRNSRISTLTDTVGGQKVSLGLFRCIEDYHQLTFNLCSHTFLSTRSFPEHLEPGNFLFEEESKRWTI